MSTNSDVTPVEDSAAPVVRLDPPPTVLDPPPSPPEQLAQWQAQVDSATAKLLALGLNAAEIAAMFGATAEP